MGDAGAKIIWLTGASSGFGYEAARQLLVQGHRVYAAARRLESMRKLEEMGARIISMDVTSDVQVAETAETLLTAEGRIDALVNNAGFGAYGMVEAVPVEDVKRQFDVNLFGCARTIRAVLPTMRAQGRGRIVNVLSLVSHIAPPMLGWYAATKFAGKAMSDALRLEVAPFGIQVSQIEPGTVQTGFEDAAFEALDATPHADDYRASLAGMSDFLRRSYAQAPCADETARAIVHAATARRPRPVYRTTKDARTVPWALKALESHQLCAKLFGRFMKAG